MCTGERRLGGAEKGVQKRGFGGPRNRLATQRQTKHETRRRQGWSSTAQPRTHNPKAQPRRKHNNNTTTRMTRAQCKPARGVCANVGFWICRYTKQYYSVNAHHFTTQAERGRLGAPHFVKPRSQSPMGTAVQCRRNDAPMPIEGSVATPVSWCSAAPMFGYAIRAALPDSRPCTSSSWRSS